MRIVTEKEGDYFVVEVYDEDGQLLMRVGFDHEPSQDEVETLTRNATRGGDR